MIKKFIPVLLASMMLASCNGNASEDPVLRIASPLGAPSASMYEEGNNSNWLSEKASLIPAELQGNYYDVVIYDATTGLASIRKNNLDFALAKVITGGNFFLMGVNTEFAPTSESKIVAFQKDKIPDKVFKKLAKDKWGLAEMNVQYVPGDVSDTAAVLKTGKYQGQAVDYVLSAEPVIQSSKAALDEGVSLHEIYNLRSEWKVQYGQDAIVQAGVFVRKSSISSKKALLSDFMRNLERRLDTLVKNPSEAVNKLNEYNNDLQKQAARFGVNANLVNALQSGNKNRLGFVTTSETIDVNAFLTNLGESTFADDYFVNI